MNIYLVVEGAVGEKLVYSHWITYLNRNYKIVNSIEEVTSNTVYLISGHGYPNYLEVIQNAAIDVNDNQEFDRLVIAIDSEDLTYSEKFDEIKDHIESFNLGIDYKIIVQHFCLETWALGNTKIFSRTPQSVEARECISMFNVGTLDPEQLPPVPSRGLNRAQFADKYLRILLNEKYRQLTYSKKNPKALLHKHYYDMVKERYERTGHIASFANFLEAFN